MGSRERKANQRMFARINSRDESGNGECFAPTYRRTMEMSAAPAIRPAANVAAPADPLLDSIATCEREIATYEAKSWRTAGDEDQLKFYRSLLAKKQAELAARG